MQRKEDHVILTWSSFQQLNFYLKRCVIFLSSDNDYRSQMYAQQCLFQYFEILKERIRSKIIELPFFWTDSSIYFAQPVLAKATMRYSAAEAGHFPATLLLCVVRIVILRHDFSVCAVIKIYIGSWNRREICWLEFELRKPGTAMYERAMESSIALWSAVDAQFWRSRIVFA